MPTNKDFKRLVRARMGRTGESYTAARAQLLRQPRHPARAATTSPPPRVATPAPGEYARLAGITDAAIKAKTGCTWERWVRALDRAGAWEWSHRDIARYVREKYETPSWWTQTVTVGYERIKGLRAIGQQRDGRYSATRSRTLPLPLGTLYRAFRDRRVRERWLPDVNLTVASATRDKYIRVRWPDGTRVDIGFVRKGRGRSQIAIQHSPLPDRETASRLKAFWGERLDALGEVAAGAAK
jgi:hypothetical protein